MDTKNRTVATEFILLGLSNDARINIMLFVVFLLVYIVSINANGLILCLVLISTNLQTPMYFFLCVLSLIDLCMTSSVTPKMLVDLVSGQKTISLAACKAQFYTILIVTGSECLLLALMAYDRYVAICRPLHYTVMMSWSNCYRMIALMCIFCFMMFTLPSLLHPMDLCYPNQINHFMCEALAVIQLACDDIHSSEVIIVVACFLAFLLPFLLILISYIFILSSVLKMKSARRSKALLTCSSHVIVVVIYYGMMIIMYLTPSSKHATNNGKYLSLCSNVICPTLNPIIYCLNNKDVREAQRKLFSKIGC